MNLFEYLSDRKKEISEYLIISLQEKAEATDKNYAHLYDSLREFSTKGKLLRGSFFLLSYEMAGGKKIEDVLPAAAAIEINGSALLIHDDIMDNDLLRRGRPSMFAQYIDRGKSLHAIDPEHYGISAGILIGDMAILLGFEFLGRAHIKASQKDKVLDIYAKDMQYTAVGQMMDFDVSSTDTEPTEDEILTIYAHKTAQYSLVNPFLMGAEAAGATEEYRAVLTELCQQLGIIFQIRDDVMGLMGDDRETGKTAKSDVRENKKTLIRRYLYEAATGSNKELLDSVFGSDTISDDDFGELIAFVHESNVLKKVESKLSQMADIVRNNIAILDVSDDYKSLLHDLVDYSLTRSK